MTKGVGTIYWSAPEIIKVRNFYEFSNNFFLGQTLQRKN